MHALTSTATFGELLIEDRQPALPILAHGLDQRHVRTARTVTPAFQAHTLPVFLPRGKIRDKLYSEGAARSQDSTDFGKRRSEIAIAQE
jgi:hypothetical protein